MQYRIRVKPGPALATQQLLKGTDAHAERELAKVGKAPRVEPVFEYLSPRIPYEIGNLAHLSVTRELVIPIKMKDIFSNKSLFLAGPAKELYAQEDHSVFIDFFGYGTQSKMLIGQLHLSLVELIQASMTAEAEQTVQAAVAKARKKREEEKKRQAELKAESGIQSAADEKVSGKAQALEQQQAVKVAQAQDEAKRARDHRNRIRQMRNAGASEDQIRKAQEEFDEMTEMILREHLSGLPNAAAKNDDGATASS